jgi:hypothetical protein
MGRFTVIINSLHGSKKMFNWFKKKTVTIYPEETTLDLLVKCEKLEDEVAAAEGLVKGYEAFSECNFSDYANAVSTLYLKRIQLDRLKQKIMQPKVSVDYTIKELNKGNLAMVNAITQERMN